MVHAVVMRLAAGMTGSVVRPFVAGGGRWRHRRMRRRHRSVRWNFVAHEVPRAAAQGQQGNEQQHQQTVHGLDDKASAEDFPAAGLVLQPMPRFDRQR
jgi:hypothetical protein